MVDTIADTMVDTQLQTQLEGSSREAPERKRILVLKKILSSYPMNGLNFVDGLDKPRDQIVLIKEKPL